ncbi:hypothetical protein JTE90_012247 [Oedothorax gibbosus]|uniref:Uncharacterized protein n=1 Tax=Oedothorax gibbosus TaxID=931172 RepID=A0AAV6TDJ7_9ARAC|nr:hypothetical protein JTE90_012247 [Oedothorax gibbosus]
MRLNFPMSASILGGNFGGKTGLLGFDCFSPLDPDLTIKFARQNRYGPPPDFSFGPRPVRACSPSFGPQTWASNSPNFHKGKTGRVPVPPRPAGNGVSRMRPTSPGAGYFHFPRGLNSRPIDRAKF